MKRKKLGMLVLVGTMLMSGSVFAAEDDYEVSTLGNGSKVYSSLYFLGCSGAVAKTECDVYPTAVSVKLRYKYEGSGGVEFTDTIFDNDSGLQEASVVAKQNIYETCGVEATGWHYATSKQYSCEDRTIIKRYK